MDSGSVFAARKVRHVGVETLYIEPGNSLENGYVAAFSGKLRDELANQEIFNALREAQALIKSWGVEHDQRRPHSSLGYRPPAAEAI